MNTPYDRPDITDPNTLAAWADYEAANEASVDAYHDLPTVDRRALLDHAIDTVPRPFTASQVKRATPRQPSYGELNTHLYALTVAEVLTVVGQKRGHQGKPVNLYDFTPTYQEALA